MTDDTDVISTHPRIRERREEIKDASLRSRNRKLIAAGIVIFLVLLAAAATQSPLLDVDEVRVVGAVRRSPEYIREVADVELGTPLLGLDDAGIEQRLAMLPEISEVTVRSDWGGVVTVDIVERLPAARFDSVDGTIVVAADGTVLEVSTETFDDLPLISGAMFEASAGEVVPDAVEDALLVASSMPPDIATVTDRVEITVDSLVLRLTGGGQVSLGDSRDLETKFDAVRAFLAQVQLDCLDTLNVQAPRVPVIVRRDGCR